MCRGSPLILDLPILMLTYLTLVNKFFEKMKRTQNDCNGHTTLTTPQLESEGKHCSQSFCFHFCYEIGHNKAFPDIYRSAQLFVATLLSNNLNKASPHIKSSNISVF